MKILIFRLRRFHIQVSCQWCGYFAHPLSAQYRTSRRDCMWRIRFHFYVWWNKVWNFLRIQTKTHGQCRTAMPRFGLHSEVVMKTCCPWPYSLTDVPKTQTLTPSDLCQIVPAAGIGLWAAPNWHSRLANRARALWRLPPLRMMAEEESCEHLKIRNFWSVKMALGGLQLGLYECIQVFVTRNFVVALSEFFWRMPLIETAKHFGKTFSK